MAKSHPHYHAACTHLKLIYGKLLKKETRSALELRNSLIEWSEIWSSKDTIVPADAKELIQFAGDL